MSGQIVQTDDAEKDFERVLIQLATGVRDMELMRRSRERMDRMREDLRQRIGTIEVAVDLIRDARNQ